MSTPFRACPIRPYHSNGNLDIRLHFPHTRLRCDNYCCRHGQHDSQTAGRSPHEIQAKRHDRFLCSAVVCSQAIGFDCGVHQSGKENEWWQWLAFVVNNSWRYLPLGYLLSYWRWSFHLAASSCPDVLPQVYDFYVVGAQSAIEFET